MNARCPHCANVFLTEQSGPQFCPMCGQRIDVPSGQPVEGAVLATDPARPANPWEQRDSRPALVALFETWKAVMFDPARFWNTLPLQAAMGPAVLFGWLMMLLRTLPGLPLVLAMNAFKRAQFDDAAWAGLPPELRRFDFPGVAKALSAPGVVVAAMIGLLVVFPVLLLIGCGILHVLVKMFGGKGDFTSTVRAYGYSLAPLALSWIPCLGGLVALYTVVLLPWGLSKLHRIGIGAAVAVVLVPVFLFLCCSCGLAAFAVAAIAGKANG